MKPVCECCNSDKYIHERSGGGYRCERCKTLFSSGGAVVGGQNYEAAKNAFDIFTRAISTGRFAGIK
jgi:hypothetical protein